MGHPQFEQSHAGATLPGATGARAEADSPPSTGQPGERREAMSCFPDPLNSIVSRMRRPGRRGCSRRLMGALRTLLTPPDDASQGLPLERRLAGTRKWK